MELRHLRVFVCVAEELHFGRAARRLRVAQPAVSQTIGALENDLRVRLLERSRRHVALTAAGERFLDDARALLRNVEAARERAHATSVGHAGRLRLAFTSVATLSALPSALSTFQQEHPSVVVDVEQLGTQDQKRKLVEGSLDLGFTVMPGDLDALSAESISSEPLTAFLPAHHPLATFRYVGFKRLLEEPALLMSRRAEPAMHAAYRRMCFELDRTPKVVLEVENLEAMLAFVRAGLGVSFAPASVLQLRLEGVVGVPISPRIDAGVSMLWDPGRLPATASLFLETVRRACSAGGPVRKDGRASPVDRKRPKATARPPSSTGTTRAES